ncbi:MAG: crotonase/enoyl-CoA hydratase family protein [Burkholderiaceae bacterium]
MRDAIVHVEVDREAKRNALCDSLVLELERCFRSLPRGARAVLLSGVGKHFCAGLDLSEMSSHDAAGGVRHSRMWHEAFRHIQYAPAPVIAVLRGAVIGGGLEMAAATHLRVAEPSAFFALPEGSRGLFLGGGGSVRIARLIGVPRVADMMLTGRTMTAEQAERIALVNYLVDEGEGMAHAVRLAERIASNAPMSNYAIVQALPRIVEQGPEEGLFTESLMAAIAQADEEAKSRMRDFLSGKAGTKVRQSQNAGSESK